MPARKPGGILVTRICKFVLRTSGEPRALFLFAVFALKFLARLEAHGFSGRDVDFFAGARIASDAGLAGLHAENTEAAELDALAAAKCLLQGLENGFDGLLGLGAAYICRG